MTQAPAAIFKIPTAGPWCGQSRPQGHGKAEGSWPFVAADLALRADGTQRVVELGDGQGSDRPASTEPAAFLNAVLAL